MIKGIHTTESSMRPKLARMEVLANNLANINSTGFKKDKLFVQVLNESAITAGKDGDFDDVNTRKYVDFSDGSLAETGNPLDLAMQGPGFFVVDTPVGPRFTRAGSFRFDADGKLVTSGNLPVQGATGYIRLPQAIQEVQGEIRVLETGEMMLGKDLIGQLSIVNFARPSDLVKDGASFFRTAPGQLPIEVADGTAAVRQGFLEESNVDGIEEMMEMIELNRGFETDQKALQSLESSVERALDIGRV